MRAGRLTETITIKEPITERNEYGEETKVWKDFITTRSEVRFNNGNRAIENNEIITNYTRTFVIRYYHNIDESMQILWKGNLYRITAIDADRLRQSTTIIGEKVNE